MQYLYHFCPLSIICSVLKQLREPELIYFFLWFIISKEKIRTHLPRKALLQSAAAVPLFKVTSTVTDFHLRILETYTYRQRIKMFYCVFRCLWSRALIRVSDSVVQLLIWAKNHYKQWIKLLRNKCGAQKNMVEGYFRLPYHPFAKVLSR